MCWHHTTGLTPVNEQTLSLQTLCSSGRSYYHTENLSIIGQHEVKLRNYEVTEIGLPTFPFCIPVSTIGRASYHPHFSLVSSTGSFYFKLSFSFYSRFKFHSLEDQFLVGKRRRDDLHSVNDSNLHSF